MAGRASRRSIMAVGLALLAAWSSQPVPAGADEPTLTLITEDNRPFNYRDPATGEIVGVMTDAVRMVMAEAKVGYTVELMPWSRGMLLAQTRPDTCIFAINPTTERRPLFQWIGSFMEGGAGLYSLVDRPVAIRDMEAAKAYRIGAQRDSAVETWLREIGGLTIVPTANQNVFRMLQAGRIDLVADGVVGGPLRAADAGVAVRLVYVLMKTELAMACSLATASDLIVRIQQALDRLRKSGKLVSPLERQLLTPGPS